MKVREDRWGQCDTKDDATGTRRVSTRLVAPRCLDVRSSPNEYSNVGSLTERLQRKEDKRDLDAFGSSFQRED